MRTKLNRQDAKAPRRARIRTRCTSNNSVVGQPLAFRETVGDFGTLLYCGHDWAEPRLARRSMELMAEKVMPAVNAAIGSASRAA